MKKSVKFSAIILSAVLAISAGTAMAVTANAASQANAATPVNRSVQSSASVKNDAKSVDRAFLTSHVWNVSKITDEKGNEVNPYMMFGTSFRLSHEINFNNDGSFAVYIGANCGNDPKGSFKYNELSGKMILNYDDGFNAAAYVAYDDNNDVVLKVPVMYFGQIYSIDFKL